MKYVVFYTVVGQPAIVQKVGYRSRPEVERELDPNRRGEFWFFTSLDGVKDFTDYYLEMIVGREGFPYPEAYWNDLTPEQKWNRCVWLFENSVYTG